MNPPNDTESSFSEVQYFIAEQLRQRKRLDALPAARAGAEAHLTGNQHLAPVETLEIYRRQFWLRHTASLVEDFPGVSGILGQQEWEQLAESYLTQVAPESWTLRDLGKSFQEHLLARAATPHHALCVDMARLEWAYVEVFDAAEHEPLDGQLLAAIDESQWPTARLVTHPALRLLRTSYPVAELRKRLLQADGLGVQIPEPAPDNLVIYRGPARGLRYTRLDDAPMALLEALMSNTPLQRACECAAEQVPGSEALIEREIGHWFTDWGKRAWIVDVLV